MYAQAVSIAKKGIFKGLVIFFVVLAIILTWGGFTCWKYFGKCPEEKSGEEQLKEDDKERRKEYEEEMKELSEGKMCNFINIENVDPNPDKDDDKQFDADESVPCEKCEDYKLNGVKMYPEYYDSQKKDGLFYCRASLVD